jgi:UDP-2,3-diacylglucosamine pyrophosphatase LpxH
MKLAFDLISDLHVETWDAPIDWSGQATSMMCVVAGDISRDHSVVADTLRHLGECYRAVFYIDGNDEHRHSLNDLGESYKSLAEELEDIPNVTYLQDNVCIVDGVAFLATNAW